MLIEAISYNKKILSCNFTNDNYFDFPFFSNEIGLLKKKTYISFEKRVRKILSLKKDKYFSNFSVNKKAIIGDSHNTLNKLRTEIRKSYQ